MKNLLQEHRIKREKAIAEHKQNELLRLKQEKQAWFNNYRANMASWHENYEPDLDTCIDRLWWQNCCYSPQHWINSEGSHSIEAIKRSWGGVVMPAYYFNPIQFEYTQQAKNLETEKAGIQQILRNEFIDILHKLYPNWYPVNFKDWPADSWGKRDVIDKGDYETIQANLPTYRRQLAEKLEAERLEAARIKVEQLKAQKLEEERLQAEKLKAQKLEAERLEAQRLELQRLETERIKGEQLKAQKLEEERLKAQKLEFEKLELESIKAEKLEAERLEAERLQTEKLELERLKLERVKAEQLEIERLEAEKLEAELGMGVSNNHDFVEVQLQGSLHDEYFQWSAEYQYDPSMFLK